MWIFQRLIRCLIRRREGEHGGTWGKDASMGGVWVGNSLPGAPLAPMPKSISAGSLPPLNLLFDPRAVHFGTPLYQVLLQHWAQLGWVKQLCQGKAVVFGVDWATVQALPRPIYDPGCQPSYEGLIPNSRSVKRWPRTWPRRRPNRPQWTARGSPIEAPTAAARLRDSMG